MNKSVFINNRKKLISKIEDNSILIFFAGKAPKKSGDQNYDFTPNRNFYYFSGIDEEDHILVITKINNKVDERLFLKDIDKDNERWIGKSLRDSDAKEISGISDVNYKNSFKESLSKVISNVTKMTLYLDIIRDDFDTLSTIEESFAQDIQTKYPNVWIKNSNSIIRELRLIKSTEEVNEIREAIRITIKGVNKLMEKSKAGMKEYELEAYFDFVCKKEGAKDTAFKTIAAGGKNATILHYTSNDNKLNDGDLVLFDLGAQYNYYNADITRTFPINGTFTKRQREVYEAVLRVNERVINTIKPGLSFKELNNISRDWIAEECIKLDLIKNKDEVSKYYWHGIGHSLGLDTHDIDSKDRDTTFEEGMVWTVEPGIYISEESIGIRIEDNVLVTSTGVEVLTKDMIKSIKDIEKLMK